jgi:hypothetical protein
MLKAINREMLRAQPLFQGLSDQDLNRIARDMHRKTCFTDTIIITADEPGEFAYIIVEAV